MKHRIQKTIITAFIMISGSAACLPAVVRAADISTPVILIPGTTRSLLKNQEDKIVWGNWRSFFHFRKGGFLEIELTSTDPLENKDGLRPAGILKKITLLPKLLNLDSYKGFLKEMKKAGYQIGDIRHPETGDNFFIFDYDWRLDQVENARRLSGVIDGLKTALNKPEQKFNIIAHSSGSYIARYYMMYGGEDILSKDNDAPTYQGAKNINHLFLIAPLHKGTMIAFQILNEGYVPVRHFPVVFEYPPHAAFSSPAFFELMPPKDEVFFVGPDGHEVHISPYDAENWVKFKWSVFSPKEQKRLKKIMKKKHGKEWKAALKSRNEFLKEYLQNVLDRADSFHEALDKPLEIPADMGMTIFIARSGSTLARAEFSPNPGRLTFRSNGSSEFRFEEGDGIVTLASMLGDYSKGHQPENVFIQEKHSRIASNETLHRELLSRLTV